MLDMDVLLAEVLRGEVADVGHTSTERRSSRGPRWAVRGRTWAERRQDDAGRGWGLARLRPGR